MSVKLTDGERLELARGELKRWLAEAYKLQLQARGHKALGNQGALDTLGKSMANIEAMMDVCRNEIEALTGDAKQSEAG